VPGETLEMQEEHSTNITTTKYFDSNFKYNSIIWIIYYIDDLFFLVQNEDGTM